MFTPSLTVRLPPRFAYPPYQHLNIAVLSNPLVQSERVRYLGRARLSSALQPMKKSLVIAFLVAVPFVVSVRAQQSLDAMIDREIAQLVSTYKMLHAAPELSHYEDKTSTFLATQLRSFGYTVTEHVGKYDRPQFSGYGVVAVMKNGDGPTVLVRADIDALPVEE